MTKRGVEVLRMLAARVTEDGEYASAAHVQAIEWRRTPAAERRFLPTSQGVGQALAALHRAGLAERQFNQYHAVWEYRPTAEGWRQARLAGWKP